MSSLTAWTQEFSRKIRILLPEKNEWSVGSWQQQMFITNRNVIAPVKKHPVCWETKKSMESIIPCDRDTRGGAGAKGRGI